MICRNAIVNLLNIGRKLFETAQGINVSKPDGQKGRTGTDSNKSKYYIDRMFNSLLKTILSQAQYLHI